MLLKAGSAVSRLVKIGRDSKSIAIRNIHVEKRIEELGLRIPQIPEPPKGNYMSYVQTGNLLYLAGHLPKPADGEMITGKLGKDLNLEEGQYAARMAGLQMISSMIGALGDLDRVQRVVKLQGFISSTDTFTEQATVLNGCSDLMGEVFGVEVGRHARSAIATHVLPLNVAVEVEAIIEVKD
jgi:enamine deaminase RidA (YjgF/YER057c/UK114 family)